MVNLIWSTRGRSWGFRFLLDGGYADPLQPYERAFIGLQDEREACQRVGEVVALRFPDPEHREDAAGRVIPHDFVVMEPLASEVNSIDDGVQKVWAAVKDVYEQTWQSQKPPSIKAVQSAIYGGPSPALDVADVSGTINRTT